MNKKQENKPKKANPINTLLSQRITDRTFKLIFFSVAGTVVGAVIFLLLQIQTLRGSYETIAKQQAVTILDESGNVFKKRLYETNIDIATIFGITYAKKSLGYGYLNYNRILNFVKVFSTREVSDKFYGKIKTSLRQLKILNGTNVAKIISYKMNNADGSNKKFILQARMHQELISESQHNLNDLFLQLTMEFAEPTSINSSGIFVTKYEIEPYDMEKHQPIFE